MGTFLVIMGSWGHMGCESYGDIMGTSWGHGDIGDIVGSWGHMGCESYGDMGTPWGHLGDMGTIGDILGSRGHLGSWGRLGL